MWQPTVTLYWNIWNSRKIILMSPKKEKLYYSKLWRKKERGKISFSNHKCVSCLKPTRSSTTLQNIFTFFFYYQLTKNYTHGAKKGKWMTHFVELGSSFLRSVDILISLSTLYRGRKGPFNTFSKNISSKRVFIDWN